MGGFQWIWTKPCVDCSMESIGYRGPSRCSGLGEFSEIIPKKSWQSGAPSIKTTMAHGFLGVSSGVLVFPRVFWCFLGCSGVSSGVLVLLRVFSWHYSPRIYTSQHYYLVGYFNPLRRADHNLDHCILEPVLGSFHYEGRQAGILLSLLALWRILSGTLTGQSLQLERSQKTTTTFYGSMFGSILFFSFYVYLWQNSQR